MVSILTSWENNSFKKTVTHWVTVYLKECLWRCSHALRSQKDKSTSLPLVWPSDCSFHETEVSYVAGSATLLCKSNVINSLISRVYEQPLTSGARLVMSLAAMLYAKCPLRSVDPWLIEETSHVNATRPSEGLRERAPSNYVRYFHGKPTPVEQHCSQTLRTFLRQISTQGEKRQSVAV